MRRQAIELEPTIHLGVGAKAIARKAEEQGVRPELERIELNEQRRSENVRRILRNPAIVLDLITREKSVFDERDVAKVLHRYVDDPAVFQQLMLRIILNPEVLRLQRDTIEFATGEKVPARYSTRAMIRLEATMVRQAIWLSNRDGQAVSDAALDATFRRHERLSDEQKTAIERIAGPARIAAVVGRAGAGKTTMMKAAREAWELAGYRVVGGALAGKAAEGLEKEAGIQSRTLASWELRWNRGRDVLDDKTVFVLDEAGMVASKQMGRLCRCRRQGRRQDRSRRRSRTASADRGGGRLPRPSLTASVMPNSRRSIASARTGCARHRSIWPEATWKRR